MMPFPIFLLACYVAVAWTAGPPRLDVGEEVVIRTEHKDYLELRCEGSQRLNWDWTSSLYEEDAVSETEEQENSDYPYVSTLKVHDVIPGDTGFYHCHYDNYKKNVVDTDNVASTYVYIYDGENILVNHGFTSVTVTTSEKLTLKCRTTLPDATVTLKKNGGIDILNNFHTVWDPKIGFVILTVTVQDSGMYTCNSGEEKQLIQVSVIPDSSKLQTPNIDEGPNPHFILGHSFTLSCTLLQENAHAALHWSYPNAAVMYNVSQVEERDKIISTLIVPSASKKDSGTYTCTATTSQFRPTTDSLDIEILDTLEPYVTIVSPDNITVTKDNTTTVKWKAEVFSFPKNPDIVYRNWQGDILTDNERIDIKFDRNEAFSWLILHNITASDFGQYSLTATTRDGAATSNATLTIQIKNAPLVEVLGVPDYVWPESKLQIICSAQGFPVPSVVWEFQSCTNGRLTCSPYQNIEVNEGSLSYPAPGNLVRSTSFLTAKSSGFLRCQANNSLGVTNSTVPVSISDIGGLHVLSHTGLNKTMEITSSAVLTVIVNDGFLLTCGANKLHYEDVTLHTPPSFDEVKERESKYSFLREVQVQRVTKAVEGKYSCSAQRHSQHHTTETKNVTIIVRDEVEVKFLRDSNMVKNETLTVKENEPYFLNCTVSGTPLPTVTWRKDNKPLTYESGFFDNKTTLLSDDRQRIELKYVFRKKHVGVYTCTATNRVNTMKGRLVLAVPVPGLSTGAKVGLAVAFLGIIILIVTVAILFRRVKTERKFRKSFRANELYLFEKGNIGQLNPDCAADEQAELLPYGQEWEVPREHISLGKQLGSGAFGRVVKAKVTGLEGPAATTLAIKMCKSQADQSQIRALALELKIMIHLGKHLNIVNLMGANTAHIGKGELWILVEYCRFGNLLVFMHRHRKNFINQIDPNTGSIDITKVTPDAMNTSFTSPLSPGGSWQPVNSRGSVSHDRSLATPNSPFPLSPPPMGHAANQPQTSQAPQVHNPLYNPMSPSNGEGRFLWPNNATDGACSDVSESCGGGLKSPATTTSTASDGRVQNLYFTSTSGSSVSHGPLAPSETGFLDSHGNALIHEVGSVPGVNTPFTTSDLVCWAWQVAHGMDYLASRKVLHGDLAARNLLLADDNVVKISDFGLSRDMYKKDIYMKKSDELMPIRWISVEAIRDRIFSIQSDIWAFGVTLWEIFSLGSNPYPGIKLNNDFLQLLEDGYRMSCPKYANQDIYDLLLECWDAEPMDRPSFRQAVHRLDAMMQPDVKGEYLSMNDQYMRMNEERFKEQPDYLNMLTPPDYENMTTKGLADDLKPHYVNMEVAGGRRDTIGQQATIQSPDVVGYCNTTSSPSPKSPTYPTNPHYLPMNCTRHSPSPENDDVFSPDPAEASRFTFAKDEENSSPSKEDKTPFLETVDTKNKIVDTEHSTLITNGRRNT